MVTAEASAAVRRELFGGAVEGCLPARFQDLSEEQTDELPRLVQVLLSKATAPLNRPRFADARRIVRQVPDHQEAFADGVCDESLMVELVDLHGVPDGVDALRFFFTDLRAALLVAKQATANEAVASEIQRTEEVGPSGMPRLDAAIVKHLCVGTMTVSKFKDGAHAANVVQVLLANVRLKQVGTDILITMNTPLSINPESCAAEDIDGPASPANAASRALEVFTHFLRTFAVNDWGLFG